MSDLDKARETINRVDKLMAELFEERMRAAETIAEYKREKGLSVLDPKREAEVIERNCEYISDPTLREYYVGFINDVMKTSRSYQKRLLSGMKVAFSGTLGAFAHIAASKIFPYATPVSYGNFKEAYNSVVNGESDCAVLPLENSYAGEVGQVIDMLFSGNLYISGVYDLPVIHDLVSVEGADISKINTVVSHPQALSQCAGYIREHGFSQVQYENTAMAAEYIAKKGDPTYAAICSKECAEIFGLKVLDHHINESRSNTTRFGVFTRAKTLPKQIKEDESNRFILMFTVRNKAGALAEAINIIGKHGYNMSSLRSRPMKELMWNYYFYLECEGTPNKEELFTELSAVCDRLKLVGAYKTVSLE